jgi:MarR family 2-MHQ and catechol resistance regulon transcriptional repressor
MGTHYDGSKKERRALDAYVKLRRATESVSARLSASFSGEGLTESQFGVLEVLHHLGSLCQADLGKKILRSGGNMTMVIDNLERRGLVTRQRDPQDRRYSTVSLTAEGQKLIDRIFPAHVDAVVDEFGRLTTAEQEELARLCRKLGLAEEPSSRRR